MLKSGAPAPVRKPAAPRPARGTNSSFFESLPFLGLVTLAFAWSILRKFGFSFTPHAWLHEVHHKIDPKVVVIDSIPGEGHFKYPHGVCLSPDGSLFFISEWFNDRVQVFRTSDQSFVRSIGKQGHGIGEFHNPAGCVISPDNQLLYVSDEDNHRVQVYRVDDGSHVRVISSQGGAAGLLQDPRGITLSPDGKFLVVADFGNHRVQVFSTADGTHVRTIGCGGDLLPSHGHGELYNPAGVAVSPDGQFLYVADFGDHAVEFYHFNNASFIRRVGSQPGEPGRGPDEFDHPHDVFVSHSGEFLYVADMMNDRVQVLRAKDGEFVKFIGERGQKRMQFKHPLGLALSDDGKWLYVSDFGNDRVQMLKVA